MADDQTEILDDLIFTQGNSKFSHKFCTIFPETNKQERTNYAKQFCSHEKPTLTIKTDHQLNELPLFFLVLGK